MLACNARDGVLEVVAVQPLLELTEAPKRPAALLAAPGKGLLARPPTRPPARPPSRSSPRAIDGVQPVSRRKDLQNSEE